MVCKSVMSVETFLSMTLFGLLGNVETCRLLVGARSGLCVWQM